MPEWAEVRITSDFINHTSEGKTVTSLHFSPYLKLKSLDQLILPFVISAKSRGKELALFFRHSSSIITKSEQYTITLGMSGEFVHLRKDEASPKHSHAHFVFEDQTSLVFVDVRRFGKGDFRPWADYRGPDPVDQFDDFKSHIYDHINKTSFQKPISELLMDQRYFNGVGNYLRAEICGQYGINPFLPAIEVIDDMFLEFVNHIMRQSYTLAGGSLHRWNNPFSDLDLNDNIIAFDDWLAFYGKAESVVDKTGRRFWFDARWQSFAAARYI